MKAILIIVVCSTVVGLGFGVTLAVMQISPVAPTGKAVVEPPVDLPVVQIDENAPRAEVPETIFEFGSIEMGATRSHLFEVRNVGGSPLHVEVGETTCKCTVGDLEKSNVEPGGSTEIRLEWVAKTGPGPFRHGATIITNDPAQSHIQLSVEGKVIASTIMLSPSELIFGSLQVEDTRESEVILVSFVEERIKIGSHEILGEGFNSQIEVRFEPLDKEELPDPDALSGIKILATYRAGATIGPVKGQLILSTNLKNAEKLNIPISSLVLGDISIYGPGWKANRGLLSMGKVRSTEGKTARLILAIRGDHAAGTEFKVASVDPPDLKVTFGEPRQMKEQLLHVPLLIEVPAGTKPMVWMGEPASSDASIVLETTLPETTEIQLKVNFAVVP